MLTKAGLSKIYVMDLEKALGQERAAKVALLSARPFDIQNQSLKSKYVNKIGSPWKQAALWVGAFCIGAALFAFASAILKFVGGALILIGLFGMFARDFRSYALACLIAGTLVFGWGEGMVPAAPSAISEPDEAGQDLPPVNHASSSSYNSPTSDYTTPRERTCSGAGRWAARMIDGKKQAENQYKNLEAIGYC